MTKFLPLYILGLLVVLGITSCNEKNDEPQEYRYDNVAVQKFNLKKNDSILKNIDSVFFSIDLNRREIFNADSLPLGTRIDSLSIVVGTSTVSGVEVLTKNSKGQDTTYNILNEPNTAIDFSKGPVTLRITSYGGEYVADYKVTVNVHKMKPDSLYWNRLARRNLPSSFSNPSSQKTTQLGEEAAVLTTDESGAASIAFSADPYSDSWTVEQVNLPSGSRVETFSSAGDALFILASDKLYHSTDKGRSWTDTGVAMTWIYGEYNGTLLGINGTMSATYPESAPEALPDGMPVTGTSQLVCYDSKWSSTPMVVMVGGRDSSGKIVGDAWGYDNGEWACLSHTAPAREGITLIPYYTYKVSTNNWKIYRYPTLLAIGGRDASGRVSLTNESGKEVSPVVSVSIDRGLSWADGGILLDLPDYIPAAYGAQALVFETRNPQTRGASAWTEMAPKSLMPWYEIETLPETRVSQAVTTWDTPYIYLFGGMDADGRLYNNVWRGVLNRLSFKPLY